MKKIAKKTLIKTINGSIALLASFGLVFGLAFADKTSPFLDFNHPKKTLSYYAATPQKTIWNITDQSVTPFSTPGAHSPINQQDNSDNKFSYGALVVDGATHQVLDKSFNQSGYQGLVDWIWNNPWFDGSPSIQAKPPKDSLPAAPGEAKGVKPGSDNSNDFWQTYDSLVNNNFKTLVLPGYMHQTGLSGFQAHSLPNYQKAGYILLDANTPEDRNIASVIFRADQAAFLTGIAICQYLNDNFDEYSSGGLRVGSFGGIAIPSVTIYMGGLEYGIESWNQNVNDIAKKEGWTNPEDHKVNFINLGQPDSFFSNSFSMGDGKPLVQALLQRGADAILPVAGPQTMDAVKEIRAYKSNCAIIGVDTAQELDPTINLKSVYTDKSGDDRIVKFSAVKNISNVTSKILALSMAGESTDDSWNGIGSFGYLTVADITNNGIESSDPSWPYLLEFIENFTDDPIPQDKTEWWSFIIQHLEELSDTGTNIPYLEMLSQEDHMAFRV